MEIIRPQNDLILILPDAAETKSAGGLFLVQKPRPKNEGVVVAIGPGRVLPTGRRNLLDLAVGDRVAYSPYGHESVIHQGVEHLLVDATAVYAVVGSA